MINSFTYLVRKSGRTPANCLDAYLEDEAPDVRPVYLSCMFKPTAGNGPYFFDADFDTMVRRVHASDEQRWATIFRADTPCFLHVDIDDKRPGRPSEMKLVESFWDVLDELMTSVLGVTIRRDQWLVCSSRSPSKTSIHLHSTSIPFASVLECKNLMASFCQYVEKGASEGDDRCLDLCSQVDGKWTHVTDCSIYHHNALLKLPFQHKPGKPRMMPRWYKGESDTFSHLDIIGAGMAHRPELMKLTPSELYKVGPTQTPAPVWQRLQRMVSSPPRRDMKQLRKKVEDHLPENTPFALEYRSSDENGREKYYVKFEGPHKCAWGREHDSNNSELIIYNDEVQYFCFSSSCPDIKVLGPLVTHTPPPPRCIDVKRETALCNSYLQDFKEDVKEFMNEETFCKREIDGLIHKLKEQYLELVNDNWVKIKEKKVVYGERRILNSMLCKRPGLSTKERKITQFEWMTREKSHFVAAVDSWRVWIPTLRKRVISYKLVPLVDVWLKWAKAKTFERIVHEPDPSGVFPEDFNNWTPFAIDEKKATNFVVSRGWTEEKAIEVLRPYTEHMFHIIANGDRASYDYIMAWHTFILQKKKKTGVCVMLMGGHGAGKSTVVEWFAEILGPVHACTLTKSDELTGTFNAHLGFKILVVSEEATYGGTKKDQGHLKHLITGTTINVRPLYHPMITIKSRHNIVVISNLNRHALPIDATERRYACFYPSKRFVGIQTAEAKEYFDRVRAVPPHLVAWYHYTQCNVDSFNPRLNLPVTEATTDQKIRSMNSAGRFLLFVLQTSSHGEWSDSYANLSLVEWHGQYCQWCIRSNIGVYQRVPFQEFVDMLMFYLLKGPSVDSNGTDLGFRLHESLDVQRLKMAGALQIETFPELAPVATPTRPVPTLIPQDTPSALEIMMDPDLSDTERDERLKEATRKYKRPRISCPEGCDGQHPEYVRNVDGRWMKCRRGAIGYQLWHEAFDAIPPARPPVRRVLFSHDVDLS